MSSSSIFDGVVNSNALLAIAFGPIFLAFIPVTNYITGINSFVQKSIETLLAAIPGSASIPSNRVIPALSAFYIFWTFAATGATSAARLGASRKEGLDNNHPRSHVNNLTGLPSTPKRTLQYNGDVSGAFPASPISSYCPLTHQKGFALAASLAQFSAPTNQSLINLLGLHVLAKTFVYYPAYVFDIAPLRTLMHVLATSSVINVACKVATGAK